MTTEQAYYTLGERATELYFTEDTPRAVAEAIHKCYTYRANTDRAGGRIRIRVWYGDQQTGRAWLEELDVTGYIGRSTGRIKIPLLVHNSRSMGGGALLTGCIVKIQSTCKGGRVWYQHPSFSWGMFLAGPPHGAGIAPPVQDLPNEYTASVWHRFSDTDWTNVANCHSLDQAKRYIDFMNGDRFTTGGK